MPGSSSPKRAWGGGVGRGVSLDSRAWVLMKSFLSLRTVSPDCGSHRAVTHPLILVCTEEACMVALLHYDECDPWLIVLLQLDTGLSDGQQLMMEDLQDRGRHQGPHSVGSLASTGSGAPLCLLLAFLVAFCCCDEKDWPKATWERKGFI